MEGGLPLLDLGKDAVCDFADHLRRKFHAVEIFQLVMDIPCTHPPRIQGNHLFLYAGNIPLVFGNQLRLKFPVSVTGDINPEFTVLAFKGFGRMSVSLVVGLEIPLLFFSYPRVASISASISSWRISLKLSLRRE